MKDNIFTVIDKKNINGRIRNIYVKNNDNSQEKYIKNKGKFIKYFDKKDYFIIKITNFVIPKNKINKIIKIYRKTPAPSHFF